MSIKLKKTQTLGIALLSLVAFACQPTDQIDYVLLSGKITETDATYVTVKGNDFSYDIDMNEDGTFSDTLEVERGSYLFYSGRERTNIFLDKGYVLDLSIDQPQFDETLTFNGQGKGTSINNYLANKARLDEELTVDFQTLFAKDEAPFIKTVQDWKSKMDSLLTSSAIEDNIFTSTEKRNIAYEYLIQFVNFENYHQYATSDPTFKVSDDFNNNLGDLDLNNETDFENVSNYKKLVESYFLAKIARGETTEAMKALNAIESSKIKEGLVPAFSYKIQPGNDAAEEIYNAIIPLTSDSATIAGLTSKIEKIRKLQKGMASASFAYQNITGEQVSLEDLRGKYIYVDVWATWCGPCLREIPSLKNLETDFHDAPIEFVSISIDAEKDFEKWQKMVADKELKGVQLFADNSWQSDFVKAYAIDGIPRFIVIDPEGNILDPNAPRPSNPETRTLFESFKTQS